MDRDAIEARKIYDKYAECYVEIMEKDVERQNLFKNFHSLIGDIRGKRILDAGCGAGQDAKLLARRGARVFCVDLSPKMIALARKNCRGFGVKFYVGDMERTNFLKNSFDKIIAVNSMMYKKNLKDVLLEFRRILKNGGEVFIVVPHPVRKMVKYTKNYFESGRHWEEHDGMKWFGYYRTMEDYINTIVSSGFTLKEIRESMPVINEKIVYPHYLILRLVQPK